MEKVSIKKNVLFGCAIFPLMWGLVLSIVMLITGKETFTKDEKRIFVTEIISCVLLNILAVIPIVGWLAIVVLFVFWVLACVNYFKGNLDYKMILVSKMAYWFIKD